jgi:predicted nucleic acid-binding protein
MIAVDTNLLIYAHREDSALHGAANELVDSLRRQSGPWAIPWPCIHEFIGMAIAFSRRGIDSPGRDGSNP